MVSEEEQRERDEDEKNRLATEQAGQGGNPSTPPQPDPNAVVGRDRVPVGGEQAPPAEPPAEDASQPTPETPSDEEKP